jgi:hypothetical protein
MGWTLKKGTIKGEAGIRTTFTANVGKGAILVDYDFT